MGQIIVDERGRAITADNRFPVDVGSDPLTVQLSGSQLVEATQTEDDATEGMHTFEGPIGALELVNADPLSSLHAVVNGITVIVPPLTVWGPSFIGGTPSASVVISGSSAYLVNRYE